MLCNVCMAMKGNHGSEDLAKPILATFYIMMSRIFGLQHVFLPSRTNLPVAAKFAHPQQQHICNHWMVVKKKNL